MLYNTPLSAYMFYVVRPFCSAVGHVSDGLIKQQEATVRN